LDSRGGHGLAREPALDVRFRSISRSV
jgi:hypothetical protein